MTWRRRWETRQPVVVVPPAKIATGPIPTTLTASPTPRLRVKRGQITGDWIWRVLGADNEWLTFGRAASHAEALAVGLAALEAASLPASR